MTQLKFKLLEKGATLPKFATAGAACFDISCLDDFAVAPQQQVAVRTGLQVEVPEGYGLDIFSRSGHGFKLGVRLANCTGIIDSDYRGEILLAVRNDGETGVIFGAGDRVAQGRLIKLVDTEIVQVDEMSETARGAGGFGSTGK